MTISGIISELNKTRKPILILCKPGVRSTMRIVKEIEKQWDRTTYISAASAKTFAGFISSIEKTKMPFCVIEEYDAIWNDQEIAKWLSDKKNIVLVASNDVYVPDFLSELFSIKIIM